MLTGRLRMSFEWQPSAYTNHLNHTESAGTYQPFWRSSLIGTFRLGYVMTTAAKYQHGHATTSPQNFLEGQVSLSVTLHANTESSITTVAAQFSDLDFAAHVVSSVTSVILGFGTAFYMIDYLNDKWKDRKGSKDMTTNYIRDERMSDKMDDTVWSDMQFSTAEGVETPALCNPLTTARDMLAAARQQEKHAMNSQEREAAEATRRAAYKLMSVAYSENPDKQPRYLEERHTIVHPLPTASNIQITTNLLKSTDSGVARAIDV